MGTVLVTIKVMPTSPEVTLDALERKVSPMIANIGQIQKVEPEPIAFGLEALNFSFTMDEDKGDTEPLENEIAGIEDVQSATVVDVRRTLG